MVQRIAFILTVLICFTQAKAQSLDDFNKDVYNINKSGWVAYGTGATIGLGAGIIGISTSTDLQTKHFHQMNIMASVSHLSFAIPGFISSVRNGKKSYDVKTSYTNTIKNEHIWMFNAGLDIVYTSTGIGLRHLGTHNPNYPELLTGFGNALILHGACLFAIDLTMTILHIRHRKKQFEPNIQFSTGPNGIGLKWKI